MGGACGIIHFDGAPVDQDRLRTMAEAANYRGPDGTGYWVDGNVGFAHLALHSTPESTRERQPLLNRRGDLILVADARVDNRAELIGTLTAKNHIQEKNPTDADLVLAAYERWGETCPEHIIGDFSFCIWDASRRTLFAVRDPLGTRPLFYCRRGSTLFVASAISSVLAGLGSTPGLNDPLMSDFLAGRFDRWKHETIYGEIFRVPSAFSLKATGEGNTLSRNWTFGKHRPPQYRRDEEYIEHFLDLFGEAVRCRLRSIDPVGITVSGGLDSSSIACMAHKMTTGKGGRLPPQIRTYSYASSVPGAAANEHEYLEAVLSRCDGWPSSVINMDSGEFWGLKDIGSGVGPRFDEPELGPNRCLDDALMRAARRDGCRVLLSGEGGDNILGCNAYSVSSLLLHLAPGRMGAEALHFARRQGKSRLQVLYGAIGSELRGSARALMPGYLLRNRQHEHFVASAPSWLDPDALTPIEPRP